MQPISKSSQALQAKVNTSNPGIYYTHERVNNDFNPRLQITEPMNSQYRLYHNEPLGSNIKPFPLSIASPKPRRPTFADYHSASFPIVSEKIKVAIEPMTAGSVEFIPAQLLFKSETRPFWIIHALKNHEVLDHEHSEYETLESGTISWIDKLSINSKKLAEIPIAERRLFLLENTASTYLWHEDVVQAVQRVEPTGIRFFPAQGYGQDAIFTT